MSSFRVQPGRCLGASRRYLESRECSDIASGEKQGMASSWPDLNDFGVNILGAREEQGKILATQPQHGLVGEICWKDTVMCTDFSV